MPIFIYIFKVLSDVILVINISHSYMLIMS